LHEVSSSDLGRAIVVPGAAFKLNGSVPLPGAAPRRAGADTAAILAELGYEGDRVAELAERGIITLA